MKPQYKSILELGNGAIRELADNALEEIQISPLGMAIRKFFGIPCVESTTEITQQIKDVRAKLAEMHKNKEIVEADIL